jgi:hypothetical protein
LGISPLSEKIIECRNKWKAHLQRMEHSRIPLQAYKYQPFGKPEQEILLIHEVMMMMMANK